MSENWIHPVCFTIGERPVYWFGLWIAAGFLLAAAHWNGLARRDGRPRGFGSDFAFIVMLSGILGARIAHVFANPDRYRDAPLSIFRVDQGGLIFYGGFLLAVFSLFVLARIRKESALSLVDFGVTGLALGHAAGRVGCFFNGCCYGTPTSLPWSGLAAGQLRHPVQLYEAAFNLALYVALTRFYLRRPAHGAVLALYLMSYGAWRFGIEFIRGDTRLVALGLHTAQWVSLGMAAAGALLWWRGSRK